MDPEKARQLEKEVRDLISRLCESNNIELRLRQKRIWSGHADVPEIWTFERAIPLTSDDLSAIAANQVLNVVTKLHDDGIIYAESFAITTDWIIYKQSG